MSLSGDTEHAIQDSQERHTDVWSKVMTTPQISKHVNLNIFYCHKKNQDKWIRYSCKLMKSSAEIEDKHNRTRQIYCLEYKSVIYTYH